MLQKFIDWILSLFGLKKSSNAPAQIASGYVQQQAQQAGYGAAQGAFGAANAAMGMQPQVGIKKEPGSPGTLLADFMANPAQWQKNAQEADFTMEQMEMSCRERDGRAAGENCPAAQWQDEWGPLSQGQLDEFFFHMFEIEDNQPDPAKQKQLLQQFGYRHREHYEWVKLSFLKYYGTPSGSTLDFYTWSSGDAQSRMMAARMKQTQNKQNAFAAQNSELLAPVEGVSVEQYASIAARQATGLSMPDFQALLAQNGMDQAKWDRVSAEWVRRMSMDTTATIATIYGKAFSGSGAGTYGQAGAAGAAAMNATAATGQMHSAGGGEPCTFEKYCEIGGAQQAWSASGKDVNAMLKQVFNISALDWSNLSSYWMTRMMADMNMMMRMTELQNYYAQQYASAKADQDLKF
ncbi:MAG: hypothetical protein U0269_27770 [Polyangiales bacterium]